jgi:hypothetical protein
MYTLIATEARNPKVTLAGLLLEAPRRIPHISLHCWWLLVTFDNPWLVDASYVICSYLHVAFSTMSFLQ